MVSDLATNRATNRESHPHSSLIASPRSPNFAIKCNKRSCVFSGFLMLLTVVVALACSAGEARGFSRVTVTYTQKTNPPVRVQKQSADDAFEILPDRVLQHVMRGVQLTRLRQY